MKKVRCIMCMVLALLFAQVSAMAVRYLNFDHYQIPDGLVSNRVNDMTLDSRGFLWLATDCGLSRFDGAVFRNYTPHDCPSLYSDYIAYISRSGNGSIVVSGYNGFLQQYDCRTNSFVTIAPKGFSQTMGMMSFDNTCSRTYCHLDVGTYCLTSADNFSKIESLSSKDEKTINSFTDKTGNLWTISDNYLKVHDKTNKRICQYRLKHQCNSLTPRFVQLADGCLLIHYRSGQISIFKLSNSKIELQREVRLPFSILRNMCLAVDGSLWYASDGDGLWRSSGCPLSDTDFERIKPYGVSDYDFCKIYSILADKQGNIWVGTRNSGLWHYAIKAKGASVSSADLGLPYCPASAFLSLPNGHLMAACDGMGLCEFSETAGFVKNYTQTAGITNINLTSACLDRENHLLLGTWGGGLYTSNTSAQNASFCSVPIGKDNSQQQKVSWCTRVANGDCWVCIGGEGLYCEHNKHWIPYVLKDGSTEELWPNKVVDGEKGEIWISTSSSIWLMKDGKLELFNKQQFIGTDALVVSDMCYVPGYGLVLATSKGLLVANRAKKTFDQVDCCPQQNIASLVLDKKGRLLVTAGNNILRIDLKKGMVERYPHNFGEKGNNYFIFHAAYCSASGNVYFGTTQGFISIAENEFVEKPVVPKLYLTKVVADGKPVNIGDNNMVTLSYGHSSLLLTIDMADFSKMRPQLHYRMNTDEEWKILDANQQLKFDFLLTGHFEIEIAPVGAQAGQGIILYVTVNAPWWQTWWFRLLCVLLIAVFAGWKFYSMRRDRELLKQKVEDRTKELNEALTVKSRIMQVVAHDLKNPVFAVYGALQSLRQKSNSMNDTERTTALDKIIDSTRTIQDELGKLLSWATAQKEDQICQPADVNIKELIETEVNLLQLQAKEKQVMLTTCVEVSRYVYADARMLATSIRNVLGNSLKFTPVGKSVTVNAWQDVDSAIVEIKDEGVGMTSSQLDKLQSSAVNDSTKGTAGETGTGLGVGLARQYVLANGGQFSMTSKPGMGTTTLLKFPLSVSYIDTMTKIETSVSVEPSVDAELLQGNTVLVVDDDPLIAQNVKSMLESYVEVILASNGKEALEQITAHAIDIIVTDVDMPVMNGFELGKSILSDPVTNHIPLLFLSARTTDNDRLTGLLTGAVDYIPKPFSQGELLMKMNNILLLRQRQQQHLLEKIGQENNANAQNEQTHPAQPEKINPFLQKTVDVIAEHYTDINYNVEQLAGDLCMSYITFYRKVKSLSGQTPLDILTEYRLNRAYQLLSEGKTDLQDVSFRVGFPDYTYFARKFKARFGCPPKDILPF